MDLSRDNRTSVTLEQHRLENLIRHEKRTVVSISTLLTLLGYMKDAESMRERLSKAITDGWFGTNMKNK